MYPLKYRSKKVLITYFIHVGTDVKKLLNSDYRTIRVGSDTVNDVTPTFIIEPNHLFTGCPVKALHIISILAFHLV